MGLKDKLNHLASAANHLRKAAQELSKVVEDKSTYRFACEDARYYMTQINHLLSTDKGEAGLDTLIRIAKEAAEK